MENSINHERSIKIRQWGLRWIWPSKEGGSIVCSTLKTYALDSSEIINEIYESINQTYDFTVEPAKRSETCSLENAINVNIDGKLFCLAHVGQMKHKDALHMCQSLNATLPLPQSLKEHNHFTESFKRLGIDTKLDELSTKIILDVRRLPNKGKVSLF